MIVDIIVIAIIMLSVFLGYKKGFAHTAVKLAALIISITLTAILYTPISNFVINTTNIDETIETNIYKKVMRLNENEETKSKGYLGISQEEIANGMLPTAARQLAVNIVRFGIFIILLITTRILITCIKAITNFISSLPIIKQSNKIGGALYGLIRGLLLIYIVLLITLFVTETSPNNIVYEQIDKSIITKSMYENNFMQIFFK